MSCTGTCCCCCTSSKGASFFCTSIHIFIGLYLSTKWILPTLVNGLRYNEFEDSRMQVIYPLLLLYLFTFFSLGCINFIAVDKESGAILKWSMRAFLLIQILMLLTNTLLAFAFPELDNDPALHWFHHVKYMVINATATSIYFIVIWRFVFSLEHGIYVVHKKKKQCSGESIVTPPSDASVPIVPYPDSPASNNHFLHRHHLHQTVKDLPSCHPKNEQKIQLKLLGTDLQTDSSKTYK